MAKLKDVVLTDGTIVAYDMFKVTIKEHMMLNSGSGSDSDVFKIINRVTGLEIAYLENLPLPDWRRVTNGYYVRSMETFEGTITDEKNSVSAST